MRQVANVSGQHALMPELLSRTCLCACNCNVPVVALSACFGLLVLRPFLHDPTDKKKRDVTSLLCVVDARVSVLVTPKVRCDNRNSRVAWTSSVYIRLSKRGGQKSERLYMDAQHKNNNKTAVYHLEMPNYDEATHHVRSRTNTTTEPVSYTHLTLPTIYAV